MSKPLDNRNLFTSTAFAALNVESGEDTEEEEEVVEEQQERYVLRR